MHQANMIHCLVIMDGDDGLPDVLPFSSENEAKAALQYYLEGHGPASAYIVARILLSQNPFT